MDGWCKCGNPSHNATEYPREDYSEWRCDDCGQIVEVDFEKGGENTDNGS